MFSLIWIETTESRSSYKVHHGTVLINYLSSATVLRYSSLTS